MAQLLDERAVKGAAAPPTGNQITYDSEVKGFGLRVTAAGATAFILNYRAAGRERRYTIGSYPDWTAKAAREEAKALKRRIDVGEDPMAERHADRAAATVASLADRFEREHLEKRRAATQVDYRSILRLYVRPRLGPMKVAEVRHSDVERLHASIAKSARYRANRTVAVLSKMFSLAVKWEMRGDNPARGIEMVPEQKRERFLSPAEIGRLSAVLQDHPERVSANAVRLLLLTGARRGEVLSATWSQFDLGAGVWLKPAATTKQKRDHRLPLSAPALQLLVDLKAEADRENERRRRDRLPPITHVFPGRDGRPLQDIKRFWSSVCRRADIDGVRLHDLRHTYASILASAGLSLPIIGQLLGHTQPATTARYAHLMDDPLRAAAERAAGILAAASQRSDAGEP
ncbi:MAG: tyrosine-type recombinase/integrase [Rhodospirillales bacterium]|nr:tyrosine-type recombinase/integrase [Rhodospirillales bacterium]